MAIADYLRKLVELKNQLVANLNSMGVVADESEKLNTLVPKVLECKEEQNVEFVEGTDFAGTSSSPGAFSAISKISFPDGTTTIGNYAFYKFTGLEKLKIPESVTSIGERAFSGCTGLKEITIECNNLTTEPYYSYENCTNLKKLIIAPGKINKTIYKVATSDIRAIVTEIEILDGVTSIENEAFQGCNSLESITIPDSVTSIGGGTFSNCNSLESITIPDSVTSIGIGTFQNCTNLASIIIGNSVTSIGSSAFKNCSSLASITIPDSVTSISFYAFEGTALLENQTGVKYAGKWVIVCDTNVTSAEIKEGTRGIAGNAFSGCSSLTSVTIPNGVISIPENVFSGCSSLTSVTIPDSVTTIGENAFSGCSSLTEVTIPNNVRSFGRYTFYKCYKLADIYYTGTEEHWNAITKDSFWNSYMGRDVSGGTTIHYNYVPE